MSNLQIRLVHPMSSSYHRRITQVEWDRHADAVKTMHEDWKTRREMLVELETSYGFRPSMPQLNAHMKKRKLCVYSKTGHRDSVEGKGNVIEQKMVDQAEDEVPTAGREPLLVDEHIFQHAKIVVGVGGLSPILADEDHSFSKMLDLIPPSLGTRMTIAAEVDDDAAPSEELESVQMPITEEHTDWKLPSLHMSVDGESMLDVEVCESRFDRSAEDSFSAVLEDTERDSLLAVAEPIGQQSNIKLGYSGSSELASSAVGFCQSEASSLRAFRGYAGEISNARKVGQKMSKKSLPSLTVVSKESWDFDLVTGMRTDGGNIPTNADWEAHRMVIARLYVGEGLSLKELGDKMAAQYGFCASLRMYKCRLSSWGCFKNVRKEDWMRVGLLFRDRQAAGATQQVYVQIRNRTKTERDYHHFLKHCGMSSEEFLGQATTWWDSGGRYIDEDPIRVIEMDACLEGDDSDAELYRLSFW